MNQPDFERAKQYVLARLETELSPHLYYHSLRHTRDDVLPAVERLAGLAGITGEPLLLLQTAALYHDVGWVEQGVNHELIGAKIASATLPQFGYNEEQIAIIFGLIMATRWPQFPHTPLEEMICDADLDSLGRIDFFVTSQLLRLELLLQGTEINQRSWHELQREFLTEHSYFTAVAIALRGERKEKNLAEIKNLLNCF